jgi:hypothetical protein
MPPVYTEVEFHTAIPVQVPPPELDELDEELLELEELLLELEELDELPPGLTGRPFASRIN